MVEIDKVKIIWYVCGTCGHHHSTEDDAKECEAQKQYKVSLCPNDDKWKIGDLVWVEEHGTPFYMYLGIIAGQKVKGHEIIPLLSIVGRKTVAKEWTHSVLRIDAEEKRKILKWLDIIKKTKVRG